MARISAWVSSRFGLGWNFPAWKSVSDIFFVVFFFLLGALTAASKDGKASSSSPPSFLPSVGKGAGRSSSPASALAHAEAVGAPHALIFHTSFFRANGRLRRACVVGKLVTHDTTHVSWILPSPRNSFVPPPPRKKKKKTQTDTSSGKPTRSWVFRSNPRDGMGTVSKRDVCDPPQEGGRIGEEGRKR